MHSELNLSEFGQRETPLVYVVLSGGEGTRLWPVSQRESPKQLSRAFGSDTLLQRTVGRLRRTADNPMGATDAELKDNLLIVCSTDHRRQVAQQLAEIGLPLSRLILEPKGRNTAPALTLAAISSVGTAEPGSDPIMVVMPADHAIEDEAGLARSITHARAWAESGRVVTLGVVPDRAETGYGYIAVGSLLDPQGARKMTGFVEKPDAQTAQRFLSGGAHWWNSGIFVLRASVWLALVRNYEPAIYAACDAAVSEARHEGSVCIASMSFVSAPSQSIDVAIMEKIAVELPGMGLIVPLLSAWSDLGTWGAMWTNSVQDSQRNVVRGHVLLEDVSASIVHAQDRLIACLGVRDLVIVETASAVLVANRCRSQELAGLVRQLPADSWRASAPPERVLRPWGHFDVIEEGEGFRVKHLFVEPGGCLSLQRHQHRAEHWVIVNGRARVICNDRTFVLEKDESTYIPARAMHRLGNAGSIALEVVEIQTGAYLGEDDIERFEDAYGRGEQ
jgi:mannose-1-phosphate guanylyltransferase/mannose-6-phosphate isomerase